MRRMIVALLDRIAYTVSELANRIAGLDPAGEWPYESRYDGDGPAPVFPPALAHDELDYTALAAPVYRDGAWATLYVNAGRPYWTGTASWVDPADAPLLATNPGLYLARWSARAWLGIHRLALGA